MSMQEEIERFVFQNFAFLQNNYNFEPPHVKRGSWITWIDFIRDDIAVEVEIDWREFDVFVLIVRLKAGKLPKGYYISEGRRCRIHLLNLIREKQWSIDPTLVSKIRSISCAPDVREEDNLKAKIIAYRELLLSCISQILAEGERVFE